MRLWEIHALQCASEINSTNTGSVSSFPNPLALNSQDDLLQKTVASVKSLTQDVANLNQQQAAAVNRKPISVN